MSKKRLIIRFRGFLGFLESFFSTWRFPVFMLSVLFFLVVLIIAITLIPVSNSTVGSFAEEFKTWCLGYDPATGEIESIYLVMFLVQPTILSIFIFGFWFKPISRLIKNAPGKAIPFMLAGFTIVGIVGSTLPSFYSAGQTGELPFPAEKIRTHINPPEFTLLNQNKEQISLADYRNKVVMITAVYASCNESCPIILDQAREVMQQLNSYEQQQLHLMALTMDPKKDTPKMLKMTANHYKLTASNQHLLTGQPDYINEILDQLNISRRRRNDGAINHANIFILIDKQGRIAYRFTLGDRQKRWLTKAVRILINESPAKENISAGKSVSANEY